MKPQHIEALQKILNSRLPHDKLLENLSDAIIGFLTEKVPDNQMTFDEFYECCLKSPPLILPTKLFNEIGLLYDSGNKELPQSKTNAAKLFCYAADNHNINGYYNYASCLFFGDGVGINLELAKRLFQAYVDAGKNREELRIEVSYFFGLINLVQGEEREAIKNLEQVPEKPESQYKDANQLLNNLKEKNYSELCLFLFNKYPALIKEYFTQQIKMKNFLITNPMLKISLDKLYPKISAAAIEEKVEIASEGRDRSQASTILDSKSTTRKRRRSESFWTKDAGDLLYDVYHVRKASTDLFDKKEAAEREIKNLKRARINFDEAKHDLMQLTEDAETSLHDGLDYSARDLKRVQEAQKKYDSTKTEYERVKNLKPSDDEFKLTTNFSAVVYSASRKERMREYHAQERFFDPRRTKKQKTKDIATQLQDRRFPDDSISGKDEKAQDESAKNILDVSGIPTRRMITAERSVIEASIEVCGYDLDQSEDDGYNKLGLATKKKEYISVGSTTISYTQHARQPNHLGDYELDDLGAYGKIYKTLESFTQADATLTTKQKEQKIARLMLGYAKTGSAIKTTDLAELKTDLTQKDADDINRIFYHLIVKENARRMMSQETKYDFPATLIQARAIKLIAAGILSLKDVFSADAPFGVITGTFLYKNHDEVIKKIKRINQIYNDCILKPTLYQKAPALLANSPGAEVIASSEALHQELQETYGGESDSDGEGYDSSDESYEKVKQKIISASFKL